MHKLHYLCLIACMVLCGAVASAEPYLEYEKPGTASAYRTDPTINSRRTDHFLFRFGPESKDGLLCEAVFQGHMQMLEHCYDCWRDLGLRGLGGKNPEVKYKGIIMPGNTWKWDGPTGAVGFGEGPGVMGTHVPTNTLNYRSGGNGCTPHEFGHGWQNQGGLPGCQPPGWTESLANWIMSMFLCSYPSQWPAVGVPANHACISYNHYSIFNHFMDRPGYGSNFINKLIFDPNLGSSWQNPEDDDIIRKAIRCDTSGSPDPAGTIYDELGLMNARMLDMDFWNHRLDHAHSYDMDSTRPGYFFNRIAMVRQPGVSEAWYRPEWTCIPQQGMNSYIPLRITAKGQRRVVTCDFRPVSDAVRGSRFRACFVAFNKDKQPRYGRIWSAGVNSFALADDENAVYLAVYALPRICNGFWVHNDYTRDNVAMFPYRVKLDGAEPRDYRFPAPATGFRKHTNGGGIVADTAHVDATAYVGPSAMVLGSAKVYGKSRIEDYAVVDSNAVIGREGQSDDPVISGHAYVTGNAHVYGHGKVRDYGWVWGSAKVHENGIVMAHSMLSGGQVYGCAVLNQAPLRDTGLSFKGDFSGCVIRGGDISGAGTFDKGVYCEFPSPGCPDNKYQYLGYNFEKKSAIFAMDQYGMNHSYLMGEPQVVGDTVNGVTTNTLTFNGTSQYVELRPDAFDFPELTISAWVKWTGSHADQRILCLGDGAKKFAFITPRDGATGKLGFTISDGVKRESLAGVSALPAGVWTHIAVTLSGDTGTLYVDGTQAARGPITVKPDQLHAPLMVNANYIGRGNSGGFFEGSIDEFRVYNKALSAAEVAAVKGEVAEGKPAAPDTTAPSPAPGWLVSPRVVKGGAVTMTANEATDENGVLYYFRCIEDPTHDSGWISEPKYTDCVCKPGVKYTYTVKLRDMVGNTTPESRPVSVTTPAPDKSAPTPAPVFAAGPAGSGEDCITMTAVQGQDDSELIMYKFTRTGSNITSGWITSRTWTDRGLKPGEKYSYTVQMIDGHGNATSVSAPMTAVARDDTPPALDTIHRMQWECEPYTQLDKSVRLAAREQAEADVEYYYECVENPSLNSGWVTERFWTTPRLADGTYTFHFRIRDLSPQRNTTAWSTTSQAKVLPTNSYHQCKLADLADLPDSTLVEFTGRVTQVHADSYTVALPDGGASIKVTPRSYGWRPDAALLNRDVRVKGHLWTYEGAPKLVNYASVLGAPLQGKVEAEDGDFIGDSIPGTSTNASWNEYVIVTTEGSGVELPNVAAASQMTIVYSGGGGTISLYVNDIHARNIDLPASGDRNLFVPKVEKIDIPAGATLRFQRDKDDAGIHLDHLVLGATNAISGVITDSSEGNAPVAQARVYLSAQPNAQSNPQFIAATDSQGRYSVNVPPGTWYISSSLDAEVPIKVSAEKTLAVSGDNAGVDMSLAWIPGRTGKVEAETGKFFDAAGVSKCEGASDGYVVAYLDVNKRSVTHSNIAASRQMKIGYAGGGGTYSFYVNGEHAQDIQFPATGGWDKLKEITVEVNIPDHATIKFQHDPGDCGINLDYYIFE